MFCSGPQQQQKYAEQGGKPDPKYLDRLCFYINALGMITKHCDWFQTIEDTITHGLITVTCIMPRLHGPLQWLLALVSKTHTPAIPNTVTTCEWLFSFVLIEWDQNVCGCVFSRFHKSQCSLWIMHRCVHSRKNTRACDCEKVIKCQDWRDKTRGLWSNDHALRLWRFDHKPLVLCPPLLKPEHLLTATRTSVLPYSIQPSGHPYTG